MYSRSKSLAIESIVVMFVLILLSFVIFLVIRSGSGAYSEIISDKQNSESARVAYSYINMKIKQNDSASLINVVRTEFGNTLKIDSEDQEFTTYIFFFDGALYECLTKGDRQPGIPASNRITFLDGFDIAVKDGMIHITCISEKDRGQQVFEGTVALRT